MINLPNPKASNSKPRSPRHTLAIPGSLSQSPARRPSPSESTRPRLGSKEASFDEALMEGYMPLLLTQKNIIKLNKLVFAKNKDIDIRLKQIIQFQDKKHWLKFRLKSLYINFLKEPYLAYEKKMDIEDIIIFLRYISVVVNYSDLWLDFFTEEKEYILKSTD
jgi:hypothetical protein